MAQERAGLITNVDPKSPMAEAFRTLRTNIQFASLDRPLRTLLITSPGPDEGKSTILANLGVAMAQADMKVIIVDCDLRKPTQGELFGKSRRRGLTNVLLDELELDEAIQETGVPGLSLIASGPIPPNPSELLGSKKMADLIGLLQERADTVLFDTPPVMAVTDAAVLATRVDGVLLVISSGITDRDAAVQAKIQLENVNARILGVVLNRADVYDNRYYYYYYRRSDDTG